MEIKNEVSKFYKNLPSDIQELNQSGLSTNFNRSIIKGIHKNSLNTEIKSFRRKKFFIPVSAAASFIIAVLAFWNLWHHDIQDTFKSGSTPAFQKDIEQTTSNKNTYSPHLYAAEDQTTRESTRALKDQVESIKRLKTDSLDNNYVLTVECFNEEIDKAIAAHKDRLKNTGYLVSFSRYSEFEDFNAVIDSALLKQNLQILN
ncbi:MAG TPA: hypothetical protein VHO03_03395 [Ignavibacteriales bacterium]|nr:hypothetical protein [Ignavibacteriales bacterium]